MTMEKERLIDEFHKNSAEIIKIHAQKWKGEKYIDLRIWYSKKARHNEGESPTKKGLTLRADLLQPLILSLQAAQDYLKGQTAHGESTGAAISLGQREGA